MIVSKIVIFFLRGYQKWISPLWGPNCRFAPTCSEYAIQAVQKHGILKGSWLAAKRLVKCGPWHRGGVDEVP